MTTPWKLFGRDPAMYLEFFAALVMCAGLIWSFTIDQQSLLNAGAAAIAGIVGAFILHDGQSTAILGGIKALLSLVMGFGLSVSVQWQTAIMMLAGAIVAMYVRTQATAPVPTPVPVALIKKSPAAIAACLALFMFNGCATNPVVVAERTYTGAFYTMDLFVTLEKSSRDMGLIPDPGNVIKHLADKVRADGRNYVATLENATEAYKASSTQANQTALNNALAVVNSLLADIDKYLPKLKQAAKQKGIKTSATLQRTAHGHFVYCYECPGGGQIHWEPYPTVGEGQSDERGREGEVPRGRGADKDRPFVGDRT